MSAPYARAPHVGDRHFDPAPQAALLIDFDNVTLGRGSDLTKELRTLLASEIIKSKVAVQRAYADWRRYPQYIVPLSEASIDLIFAPAYGSSKKNATDIRMAIDAMELVFVRPEIGTFILLTGDSDFSSVVLKLKEYGKYVIGVGIEESSSDILVQNCDEYYSYTALTGLTKTSEATRVQFDPWVLVDEAVKKMTERRDVMRSDRLKQVMREIDKGFNETEHGFPKFSKFLAEASSRGLVKLRKMENGQYEVSAGKKKSGRGRRSETTKERGRTTVTQPTSGDPIQDAYTVLRSAMGELSGGGREAVRDSDVKRRILILDPQFDEAELGFPKFSLFLKQAEEHGVVSLNRKEPGGFTEVRLLDGGQPATPSADEGDTSTESKALVVAEASTPPVATRGRRTRPRRSAASEPTAAASTPSVESAPAESKPSAAVADEPQDEAERSERREDRERGDRTKGSARGRGGRRGRGVAEDTPFNGVTAPDTALADVSVAPPAPEEEPEPPASAVVASSQTDSTTPAPSTTPVLSTTPSKPASDTPKRTLHRRQQSRRRGPDGPPPIFEGQGVASSAATSGVRTSKSSSREAATVTSKAGSGSSVQGLPSDPGAIQRYLTHRYKGVGEKTAEQIVEAFGSQVFEVLDSEPERVALILAEHRAEALLEAWQADKTRRLEGNGGGAAS